MRGSRVRVTSACDPRDMIRLGQLLKLAGVIDAGQAAAFLAPRRCASTASPSSAAAGSSTPATTIQIGDERLRLTRRGGG